MRLSFTQLNLEGPGQKPGCMPCTDPRGCDWVEVYDGADENVRLSLMFLNAVTPFDGLWDTHRLFPRLCTY